MTLPQKLKTFFQRGHCSIGSLAVRARVNRTTLNSICSGRNQPTLATVAALAEALECDLAWLLDDAADFPAVPRVPRSQAMTTAEKVRRALMEHAIRDVCGKSKLARTTIEKLLAGKHSPYLGTLAALAEALGVEFLWLIDGLKGWPPRRNQGRAD